MSALIEKLKEFGCSEEDLSRAVERFLNNDAFYERCFTKYLADTSFKSLGEALKTNNVADIFNHAHTLKGVTANMGITPVYDEVCIIVEAVRDSSIVPEGLDVHYQNIMGYHEKLQKMVG